MEERKRNTHVYPSAWIHIIFLFQYQFKRNVEDRIFILDNIQISVLYYFYNDKINSDIKNRE